MVTSALPASRGKGRFPISKACTGPRPPAFSRTSRCHCPFQLTIQCLSFSPYSPSLSLPLSPSPSCNYSLVHSTLKTLLHCPLKSTVLVSCHLTSLYLFSLKKRFLLESSPLWGSSSPSPTLCPPRCHTQPPASNRQAPSTPLRPLLSKLPHSPQRSGASL